MGSLDQTDSGWNQFWESVGLCVSGPFTHTHTHTTFLLTHYTCLFLYTHTHIPTTLLVRSMVHVEFTVTTISSTNVGWLWCHLVVGPAWIG